MRTPLRLCVIFGAAVLTALAVAGSAVAAPPANDDFANPQTISALVPHEGSNVDSTTETSTSPTESQQLQSLTGWGIFHTTWQEWEAPGKGEVSFVVCTSFPSNVILTTGSSIPSLALPSMATGVASLQGTTLAGPAHPSGCAANEYPVDLGSVLVQAGDILRPVVSSAFNGSTGTYRITTDFTDSPSNDDFADRIELFSRHSMSGTNTAATTETNEANNPYANSRTVWYEYEAPGTSTVDVELCSTFFANLVAYSGTTLPLTPVGSNQGTTVDSCGPGKIRTQLNNVAVTAGSMLKIQVGGYNGNSFVGTFDIKVSYDGIPANDDWSNATDLGTSSSALDFGDNTYSTVGAPQIDASDAEESVWYKWTAPTDATVVIDTCTGSASNYDGYLAVFDSTPPTPLVPGDLTQLATDDDGCTGDRDLMPTLSFAATAGETYWIAFSLDPTESGPLFTEFTLLIASAPSNITLPTIDGADNFVGTEYTIDPGIWAGYSPITYTYQWQRCDNTGDNCTDISGETDIAYTLAAADNGNTVRALVTATNLGGSAQESTGTSAVIEGGTDSDGDGYLDGLDDCPNDANESPKTNGCPLEEITNLFNPTISGNTGYGETLTTDNGSWSTPGIDPNVSAPTFTYQWRRCNSDASVCTSIDGADQTTYTVAQADIGEYLNVVVTATNEDDITIVASNIVGPVPDPPDSDGDGVFDPVDDCINDIQGAGKTNGCPIEEISVDTAPTVSGLAVVGSSLSLSIGAASNNPGVDSSVAAPTATVFWRSCSIATLEVTCAPRTGTAGSYTVAASDIGRFIRAEVVWSNGEGTDQSGWSVATAAVPDPAAPTPPPATPPAPTDPLTLSVKKSLGTVRRDKKGVFTFKGAVVSCGATATGPCTGTFAISAKVGKKIIKYGVGKTAQAAGKSAAVTFKPNSKLAKAIKKAKGKKLKVTLVFSVSAPGFAAQKATATVTLK